MEEQERSGFRPGIPVDARGNPTIDPTENVKDLNEASSRRHDDLREAEVKFQNFARQALDDRITALREVNIKYTGLLRDADDKFQNYAREAEAKFRTDLRTAESTRLDQLAALRETYETRIAGMLSKSVESTSSLISQQLMQVQASFEKRISELEQFRWVTGGRSSVADPATEIALAKLNANIAALTESTNNVKISESGTTRQNMGRSEVVAWLVAGVLMVAAILGPVLTVITHHAQ